MPPLVLASLIGLWVTFASAAGLNPSKEGKPWLKAQAKNEAMKRASRKMKDLGFHAPRRWNLKADKRLKQLGKRWDPLWMSIEAPPDMLNLTIKETLLSDPSNQHETWEDRVDLNSLGAKLRVVYGIGELPTTTDDNSSLMNERRNSSFHTKFGIVDTINSTGRAGLNTHGSGQGGRVDDQKTVHGILATVKSWLIERSTCPVYLAWQDLGILFWPRYVRRGFCSKTNAQHLLKNKFYFDSKRSRSSYSTSPSLSSLPVSTPSASTGKESCSWPPGMLCVPGKEKRLKILSWQCRHSWPQKRRHASSVHYKSSLDRPGMESNKASGYQSKTGYGPAATEPDRSGPDSFGRIPLFIEKTDPLSTFLLKKRLARLGKDDTSREQGPVLPITRQIKTVADEKVSLFSLFTDTDRRNLNRKSKNGRKCRWVKVTYPVVDYCYCSC